MNPLSAIGRNERCWCGSGRKYKRCHGDHQPASRPGDPVPAETEAGIYISPTILLAHDAMSMRRGEVPMALPADGPTAKRIEYTNWDEDLLKAAGTADPPMSPSDLGRLRVEAMRRIATLPTDDCEPTDKIKQGLFGLAAESLRTVSALLAKSPKPSILWNEELDPASFLGRTLLLADHVAMGDDVFQAVLRRASSASLKRAAERELEMAELLEAGIVIVVPVGVAMAVGGSSAISLTDSDLRDAALVSWVRDQLILEGPTAREALLVRAVDDLDTQHQQFWLHGHIDPESFTEDNRFETRLLRPYDPTYDYGPWIKQVQDSAVSYYVQRTNQRLVAADFFGAEYVSASLFEARLIARGRRGQEATEAQAAVWADVPLLPHLSGPDLLRLVRYEDAVDDLRRQVRASLSAARTVGDQTEALTDLAHELEASSHRLEKTVRSDKLWQLALPGGLGAANLLIGSLSGGLLPVAGGVVSLLAGVAPFLGARLNARREAAFLFVSARRSA